MSQDTTYKATVVYLGKDHGFVRLKDDIESRLKFEFNGWLLIVPGPNGPEFASQEMTKEMGKLPRVSEGDMLIVTVIVSSGGHRKIGKWAHYYKWVEAEQAITNAAKS